MSIAFALKLVNSTRTRTTSLNNRRDLNLKTSMPKGKSLSAATRGAIMALRTCAHMPFHQIAGILDLPFETIWFTYQRTTELALGPDIKDLLNIIEMGDKKRPEPAIPQRFPAGSEVSERRGNLATKDEEYRLRTFPQIAREARVHAADSTIYKIIHRYHQLYRYAPRRKPVLDCDAK
ncbi:hypothetical protein B9Z19DRAFT_1131526 [Tuber borchii]|uniref:Uncharacterized protein n=1 Tax=Tuber borchii TaxID=42251 RepID=A0A2T6ZIL2_TUBBO|nr:hypothetical protein B9Z19DRAFT_1131526 [Tuber borchii]